MELEKMQGFCTDCGWQIKSFDGLTCCPSCGSTGSPCDYKDQVTVEINWHELRILVMWAERWYNDRCFKPGESKLHPVYGIAQRIRRQHEELAKRSPLTLASEVQGIIDEFGSKNVQHNVPGVEGGGPSPRSGKEG